MAGAFGCVKADVPDGRGQAAAFGMQAFDQLSTMGFIEAVQSFEKAGEQRRGEDGDAFLGGRCGWAAR